MKKKYLTSYFFLSLEVHKNLQKRRFYMAIL